MLRATHSRSIWILDDLTPIQQAAEAVKTATDLFDIRPAVEFNSSNEYVSFAGDRRFWGQNPEFGAAVSFYLKEAPKDVRLTIRDTQGAAVRNISGDELENAKYSGINRICWDLRHQPVQAPTGRGGAGVAGVSAGPFVLPGEYRLTLTADGREVNTRPLRVQGDRLSTSQRPIEKTHHDTALVLNELKRSLNEAAVTANRANEQIRAVQDLLKVAANPPAGVRATVDALAKRLAGLERQFGGQGDGGGGENASAQPIRNQINALKGQIMASTSLPTAQQMQQAEGQSRSSCKTCRGFERCRK